MYMIGRDKIKKKFIDIFRIKFVSDTLFLQAATVVTTGTQLVTSILLVRLLKPHGYGFYVLVFSIFGIIRLLGILDIGRTTVTKFSELHAARDQEGVHNIIGFFLSVSLLLAAVMFLVGFSLSPTIANVIYHDKKVGELARWLSIIPLLGIPYELISRVLQGTRQMRSLAFLEMFKQIATTAAIIALLITGFGVEGVILGHVLSMVMMCLISFHIYNRLAVGDSLLPSLTQALFIVRRTKIIKENLKFSAMIGVDKKLVELLDLIPLIFLGRLVGNVEAGYFKLAQRIIQLPMTLMGPIATNLLPTLGRAKSNLERLLKNYLRTTLLSGGLVFLLTISFLVVMPYLVRFFYGDAYIPVIKLVYILGINAALSGVAVGLGSIYLVLERLDFVIWLKIIILAITAPLAYFLVAMYGALGAAIYIIIWRLSGSFVAYAYSIKMLNAKQTYSRELVST